MLLSFFFSFPFFKIGFNSLQHKILSATEAWATEHKIFYQQR